MLQHRWSLQVAMMLEANMKEKPGLFIEHMGYTLGADGGGMEAMYAAAEELAQQQRAGSGSAAQPGQRAGRSVTTAYSSLGSVHSSL